MLVTHPQLRREIECRLQKILSLMKHDDLCAKAMQEWIYAIVLLETAHKRGLQCVAVENTLDLIRHGVLLLDGILSRINSQESCGWRASRPFGPIVEAHHKGEGEKNHPDSAVFTTASKRVRLSFEEVLKGRYNVLSVAALEVLSEGWLHYSERSRH